MLNPHRSSPYRSTLGRVYVGPQISQQLCSSPQLNASWCTMFNIEYGKSYCKHQVGLLIFSLKNTTQHYGRLLMLQQKKFTHGKETPTMPCFHFCALTKKLGSTKCCLFCFGQLRDNIHSSIFPRPILSPQIRSMYSRRMEATYL